MNHLCRQIRIALLLCTIVGVGAPSAFGQNAPSPQGCSFEEVTQKAGIIFSGTVTKVEPPAEDGLPAQITFKVDEGLRGTHAGEQLVIREWSGLWTASGVQRYRVGERLLMFFHTPDGGGLTSPVGGAAGRIAFLNADALKLSEQQVQAISRSPRLRSLLQQQGTNTSPGHNVGVAGFLRALRLIADSR